MFSSEARIRDSRWREPVRRIEAAALGLFWLGARALPPRRAARTGARLFAWLGPRLRKQDFVRSNLARLFPAAGPARIEALAREVWANFGAILAEYPHLPRFCAPDPSPFLRVAIAPETRDIVSRREPAIYVAAHLANWELATAAIGRLGIALSAVYAPQGNPHVDAMIQARRAALGCRFVGKANCMRRLLSDLEAGRSVGMLPDQRTDAGELVPFFGCPAPTTIGPAWLALRRGCPLVPVQVERLGPADYQVTFHAPLVRGERSADRSRALRLTAELNALFERWIRVHPGQWLCMRRRGPPAAAPGQLQAVGGEVRACA
jgi:KDO2-lipid IV(A) lauroyltransferase